MAKHKSFKLYTKHNEMGVVSFAMLAGVIGTIIGVLLITTSAGQAVLGIMTP